MYLKTLTMSAFLALPTMSRAADAVTIDSFGIEFIGFINNILLPFLFAIALVIFVYYMVRYFIIDVENYDYKERARNYAIYALIAFVLMTSVWGVVNLVVGGTGLGQERAVCPDTVPDGYCEGGLQGAQGPSIQSSGSSESSGGNWGALYETVEGVRDTGSRVGNFFSNLFSDTDNDSNETDSSGGSINPRDAYGVSQESDGQTADMRYENAVDAVEADLDLSAANLDFIETQINLLKDPVVSDSTKVETMEYLAQEDFVDMETAQRYLESLNEVRAENGQSHIFSSIIN